MVKQCTPQHLRSPGERSARPQRERCGASLLPRRSRCAHGRFCDYPAASRRRTGTLRRRTRRSVGGAVGTWVHLSRPRRLLRTPSRPHGTHSLRRSRPRTHSREALQPPHGGRGAARVQGDADAEAQRIRGAPARAAAVRARAKCGAFRTFDVHEFEPQRCRPRSAGASLRGHAEHSLLAGHGQELQRVVPPESHHVGTPPSARVQTSARKRV
mmetsp:Transcript_47840/g.89153  ORF Transcript_47840/g.89153 Transcript_47840/m.89153 type:complete len:213 (-) Transcript_47840:1135-1773(-)